MCTDVFQLIPFENDLFTDQYRIEGNLQRTGDCLDLVYRVTGPLKGLCIEPMTGRPQRKDGLWEKTCFECFIGMACVTRYWEINFSPAGHWNVYCFDGYRHGMQEEPLICFPKITADINDDTFQLTCAVDLSPIGLVKNPILVGLSAVLQNNNDDTTHWALTHPGSKPDFHQREGFAITLHESADDIGVRHSYAGRNMGTA